MAILWINLIVVYITSFFSRNFSYPLAVEVPFIKPNKLLIFICMASLVLVSGLRDTIGDTHAYMQSYVNGDHSLQNIDYTGDFGFNIFQSLLFSISEDPQLLIFTTALITNALIVLTLYKYSRVIEISLYVYITSGMYIVSMNGIRQFLAAAIIFSVTKYILNGDWKKYLLVVLIASTFHKTALILIPIYFIVRRKAWTKDTLILLFVGVIITAGFNQFYDLLFTVIGDSQYSNYENYSDGGSSVLRVVVNSVPLVIAYMGRDKLRNMWPKSDYIVNLSLLGTLFLIIATQNWIFARFNIYFGLYNLILISWIFKLYSKQNSRLIYFTLIVCYFLYFYYEQVMSMELFYRSPFLNW